jgi:hypothetical protein
MNILSSTAFHGLSGHRSARMRNLLYVAGAPAALAIVEIFHPHARNLLALDVRTWLTVHYIQAPLFALSAFSVASPARGRRRSIRYGAIRFWAEPTGRWWR